MPTLNINGTRIKVGDEFLALSPDQQNATVAEIAKSLPQQSAETEGPNGGRIVNAPIEQQQIPIPTFGQPTGPAPEPEKSLGQMLVPGVTKAVATGVEGAVDLAKGLKSAPAETVGNVAGGIAGGAAGLLSPVPGGAFVGRTVGSGVGGAAGAEVDKIIGDLTNGNLGRLDDPSFVTSALKNAAISAGAEGVAALSRPILGAVARRIDDIPYLKDTAFAKAIKTGSRVDNIVQESKANPITADQLRMNAREAARIATQGKAELPIFVETGGRSKAASADRLMRMGGEGEYYKRLEQFDDAVQTATRNMATKPYDPEAASGLVNKTVAAYDAALSKPLNELTEQLKTYGNTVVMPKGELSTTLGNLLKDPNVPSEFKKSATKLVDALPKDKDLPMNAVRQFVTDLEAKAGEFSAKSGAGVEGRVVGLVKDYIENSFATNAFSVAAKDPESYTKAVETYIKYTQTAAAKAEALKDVKLFQQLGTTEATQAGRGATAEQVLDKVFASPESFRAFKQAAETVGGVNSTEAVEYLQDQFRNRVVNKLLAGDKYTQSGVNSILMKNGVPQDRLLIEAGGEPFYNHVRALSTIAKASKEASDTLPEAMRGSFRGGLPVLNLSASVSLGDLMAILAKVDAKVLGGNWEQKAAKAMFDPKYKDMFYRLASTPLDSPEAHRLLVSFGKAVGVPVVSSPDEYMQNARAIQSMHGAGQQAPVQ